MRARGMTWQKCQTFVPAPTLAPWSTMAVSWINVSVLTPPNYGKCGGWCAGQDVGVGRVDDRTSKNTWRIYDKLQRITAYLSFKSPYMSKLYIISGCNGAGKTTASFTILPEILDCREFVNADEIARGLSPFQPESVSFEAGRIMLERIQELMTEKVNFAFETTLSTRTFVNYIKKARSLGYETSLLFFWLNSVELAIERVKVRVIEGGHDIPPETVVRRYHRGLFNFFQLYKNAVNNWMFINNSGSMYQQIAQGRNGIEEIFQPENWTKIKQEYGSQNI